ncbi:MAG: oligosaccharide flippase family protein [Candidatus Shapirobacteria bacterium]|jgi:O-antigen/teichoic acid export membrane protein
MDEKQAQELKNKSITGVVFLFLRNIGIQSISTIGFFLLTILLGPSDIGLFAIVAESVSILGYFSDFGLASALIQQNEEVTKDELQTTFLIQQSIVILILIIVAIYSPKIIAARNYGSKETFILVALCFSFFTASLKTVPSVLLERKLNFKLLSSIDITENFVFYFVAVTLAYFNFGAYAYAYAAIIRSIFGLILIYSRVSWPMGLTFSLPAVKKLFKFGIPYQLNTFIALAKDRLSNLFVASIIGREGFGYISWAQKGPRIPLSFMDSLIKVSFPTFSRLQKDPILLQRSIKRVVFFSALVTFPILAGLTIITPDLIGLIPKYQKWNPAVLPMYFFCFNAAIAAITTPLTNLLSAVGKIFLTTKFMIMWTALTWILYPTLSLKFGYLGTVVASTLVGLSSFIVWESVRRLFHVNIFILVAKPLLSSLSILLIPAFVNLFNPGLGTSLFLKIISSVLVYLALILVTSSSEITWLKRQFQTAISTK